MSEDAYMSLVSDHVALIEQLQAVEAERDRLRAVVDVAREHLAWLMWCFNQGYVRGEDRALLTNWFSDPEVSHPLDVEQRDALLAMADEVLAALRQRDVSGERPS